MKKIFLQYRLVVAIVAGVVVVGGGLYFYVRASAAPSFDEVAVTRGNVVQTVNESGGVLAENSVNLSFSQGGPIQHVYVREGDAVGVGQVLADLDLSQLSAAVDQANAALAAANARLDELTSGTRPEQLTIDESAVSNASAALNAAVLNAYIGADDAVRNQTDNLFINPQSNNPIFIVTAGNSQAQIDIQTARITIGVSLNKLYAALSQANPDPGALSATADSVLRQIGNYLNAIALQVNGANTSQGVPAATLAGYKVNVVTARTELTAGVNALTSAESSYLNAKNALALANAGATPQDIEAQKAAVLQAQAAVTGATVALNHASLRTPFAGVVQGLTAKIGQVVAPGAPVLSVVNNGGLKIEIFVSESDVGKIKEGDKALVSLDAYGTGTTFPATVTTVDASKTVVNDSTAYKVTLHFSSPDDRIKDGMTANVAVVTAEHDNVIKVPTRLVVNDAGAHFLLMKNGGTTERREVTVGLTGNDGTTEILSGVNEGDHILNF